MKTIILESAILCLAASEENWLRSVVLLVQPPLETTTPTVRAMREVHIFLLVESVCGEKKNTSYRQKSISSKLLKMKNL